MKPMVTPGVAQALVALGLMSYHAVPVLAADKSTTFNTQLQWVTQLVIKEKADAAGALKTQSVASNGTATREDVATVQRWSAAAQLPMTYKRPMSGGAHVVTLPTAMTLEDAQTVAHRMEASGAFDYVSPDKIMRPMAMATDPLFNQQWNLMPPSASTIGGANVTAAWDGATALGTGVNVGLVDTGVRADHADFGGPSRFNTGYNFVSDSAMVGAKDSQTGQTIPTGFVNNGAANTTGNNDPSDPGDGLNDTYGAQFPILCGGRSDSSWHGTFVAGQIAAQQNNGIGIAGIAPNVRIQMARALGRCGGTTSDIVEALNWLAGTVSPRAGTNLTPAKVINLSLGGAGPCTTAEQDAVNNARSKGITIVAATGNEAGPVDSPANCTGVIAVTAHTLEGDNASYANVGAQTTISAPGGGGGTVISGSGSAIASLSNAGQYAPVASPSGDAYARDIGTSMATPHVAATAALMLSVQPALTPDNIATILKQSARPFVAGTYCTTHPGVCGAGMLDAGAAITQAQGSPTIHVAASASSAAAGAAITLTAVGGAGYGNTASNPVWAQTAGSRVTLTTSGPDANGVTTATFTPTVAGVYTFSVTLTNSAQATATDNASVTVTGTASSGTGTGAGSSTPTSSTSSGGGGGGALPQWLAGLLLAGGAFGFGRRKAVMGQQP
ncbi:MprA protease, GlyGly-CTERM protein-sorting domain-containing form [Ralstonia soli]|uniref:MprA protease, GlyGly-CTERM protein-sorting domain-containing form n=1 Tax=Ralstonia soli TaxID=2953896 RepID=A0ABT1ANJ4_9RALS|nr:MprA protease, GlyGly-CTERM protein-sorting domain-containing form [Ralstonia soli]MCO5400015.1 MprA protease, GlyGly-CTERM protein-sorting domain-containing form [Ralstonia soli]